MDIVQKFEQSNHYNIRGKTNLTKKHDVRIHITRSGRLFGVTDKNDVFLNIDYSVIGDTKIIRVQKAEASSPFAAKSSTKSTGRPFVSLTKVCREWFGDNPDDWIHELRRIETSGDAEYYEVIKNTTPKQGKTNFGMLGIPKGSKLYFIKDTTRYVKTLDEKNLVFDPESKNEYKISRIATILCGSPVNGYQYFCYKGKRLSDMRREKDPNYLKSHE